MVSKYVLTFAVRLELSVTVIVAVSVQAQQFPTKAVRIIAPFPAGGATDINVRRLAERLNKLWGQPVIVDNSAGGAGISAAVTVAKSKPDGYTLFFITHPILSHSRRSQECLMRRAGPKTTFDDSN